MRSGIRERIHFLYKFLHAPRQLGSVTPSSRWLAKTMLDILPWQEMHNIAELGAGTGAITRFIPSREETGMNVLLFEKDPDFRHQLRLKFPGRIFLNDCLRLRLALHNRRLEKLDCIVSSLSFRNFSASDRTLYFEQIISSLKESGWFITFEYFPQMKKELMQHFDIVSVKWVLLNFPPALVYICRKKASTQVKQADPIHSSIDVISISQVSTER
ncbi:phospholipid methyltransferase [Paenibacillus sp. FSL K6-3166]|uniref:class I SAM-dependent methyltransferase n=1 Tax=unclassified Paenibacillus TaxID=185978 RepID=UPI00211B244A|nr:phospholipid methyltransferase [Paenibacillus sp. VTT E-133291]